VEAAAAAAAAAGADTEQASLGSQEHKLKIILLH
jgi:hypothetical protein